MQKGFVFDLDGTVYVDNCLIDGAADTIYKLKESGDKVVFLTNKSIDSISAYVEKLNHLGVPVSEKNVINSNYLVARYLKSKVKTEEKVMVIGEPPLYDELFKAGISVSSDYKAVRYVVLGWDRKFNYNKLNQAFQAWKNGAEVLATNPDRTCPVEGGQVPDCGAMIGALEGATGEKVELILGKPSLQAARFIVDEILQLPAHQCFMVGDRLETDIKMGIDYGMKSILVLTGVTDRTMLKQSRFKPDIILTSIKDIIKVTKDLNSIIVGSLKK